MKLLLYDMGTYTQRDIMEALAKMGILYKNILYKLNNLHEDAYFEKRMKELLKAGDYDGVFSVNYCPLIARICHEFGIPYLSWSYDSPINIADIETTLGYETNFVFFFDRLECEKYWKKGYKNVYHLPLAVNVKRLDAVCVQAGDYKRYGGDISMLGQLYDTPLPVLMMPLNDYEKGYLSAVIEAQLRLYGCYFLEEVVTKELLNKMNKAYIAIGQDKLELTKEGLVVAMAKHITHIERILILDILSQQDSVHLYGPETDPSLTKVVWHGSAGYFDEMPKIFKLSKINLNVSLKCIQSGIPLRALDILGCGGFLLSNFQLELAEYFIDGEEIVMYTSLEDAVDKCNYYKKHDEERRKIAQKGYEKVCELFRYENRLCTMFQTAGLL